VPSSKLDCLFPELDPNMVKHVQFLVYSELCQIIEDNETLKLIQEREDSDVDGDTLMESQKSLPGLINAERSVDVEPTRFARLQVTAVSEPQQFITIQFLQVLLLLLV